METLEYDYNIHKNRTSMDEKLYVRFFSDVLPDAEQTKIIGRAIFRDVEMVQIMIPGDKKNIVIREAREEDKQRFHGLYQKWRLGEEDPIDGFPLKEWSPLSKAQVEELKYFGFRTVEHVASASDTVCSRMAGLQSLKQRAKQWLEARNSTAPLDKLNAEILKRDEEKLALLAQMAEMQKAIAALQQNELKAV